MRNPAAFASEMPQDCDLSALHCTLRRITASTERIQTNKSVWTVGDESSKCAKRIIAFSATPCCPLAASPDTIPDVLCASGLAPPKSRPPQSLEKSGRLPSHLQGGVETLIHLPFEDGKAALHEPLDPRSGINRPQTRLIRPLERASGRRCRGFWNGMKVTVASNSSRTSAGSSPLTNQFSNQPGHGFDPA